MTVALSHYVEVYERRQRDPILGPTDTRTDVANGPMSKWLRFNRNVELVYVTDIDGNMKGLTPKQLTVYLGVKRLAGTGVRVTQRHLGELLQMAPSSVSRALVKLASFGLIAYQSNRGRYGGTVFLLRRAGDGLEWCRDAAKATVRRWARAANDRISRLRSNVASYLPGRERELYQYPMYIGRNIKTGWTAQEVAEALGEG